MSEVAAIGEALIERDQPYSSSARCTGEENSICFRHGSSAPHDPIVIKCASAPVLDADCWVKHRAEAQHNRRQ
jgi:hypothetical protein